MRGVPATDPVETARLVLAPIEANDLTDLLGLFSDPLVDFWTGPWSPAAVASWTHEMVRRWATDGIGKWIARDRLDGSLVGRGGFTRMELEGETVLELGWAVRDALTGRGYASEIGRAALNWRADFYPQVPVVAFTEVHNLASRAVMRRLGMRDSGVIHREGRVAGESGLHPLAPFALYRID